MNKSSELLWHEKENNIIILLILFFPLGLFLMWKNKTWSVITRVIISLFIILIISNNISKVKNIEEKEPIELQTTRDEINDSWLKISNDLKNIENLSIGDLNDLISRLNNCKNELILYTDNSNKMGFIKDNSLLISKMDSLSNSLVKKISTLNEKKKLEEIEEEKSHFRLANSPQSIINTYLNGNWIIDANLYIGSGIFDKCQYYLTINENNIKISARDYTNYENKENASTKEIYKGTFLTRYSTAPIMLNDETMLGIDDILYLDLTNEENHEGLKDLKLYLKQRQPKIDANSFEKVEFIGIKYRQETYAKKQ